MSVRADGFYWVKFVNHEEWEVAEWWEDHWMRTGSSMDSYEDEVEAVGEKVERRNA